MTPLELLLLALAGGVGAGLRWLVDVLLGRTIRGFPIGILAVNVTGCLALGVLTGIGGADSVLAVLGTGLIGGYTTFSTVAVDSHLLAADGERRAAWINAVGTLLASAAAAALGLWIGALLG